VFGDFRRHSDRLVVYCMGPMRKEHHDLGSCRPVTALLSPILDGIVCACTSNRALRESMGLGQRDFA
jgi:hypothetical protein